MGAPTDAVNLNHFFRLQEYLEKRILVRIHSVGFLNYLGTSGSVATATIQKQRSACTALPGVDAKMGQYALL